MPGRSDEVRSCVLADSRLAHVPKRASTNPVDESQYRERPATWSWAEALWHHAPGAAVSATIAADASVDLIVRVRDDGSVRAHLHPTMPRAHVVRVGSKEGLFGVRMRPAYGMAALLHTERLVPLAELCVRRGGELDALEVLVAEHLDGATAPPRLLTDFLAFVSETRGVERHGARPDFARAERTLQRAARRWLGMSPKVYSRIVRARTAQDLVCGGRALAEVASTLRFADQAHLTRELRLLLGRTPGELRTVGNLQDPTFAAP